MAEYADYDLVGEAPQLRPSCRLEAAMRDTADLYARRGEVPAPLPRPTLFLRAPRGMLDEPDRPMYEPGRASRWLPGVSESTVPDVNHYTITLGQRGAAAVAAAVRQQGGQG